METLTASLRRPPAASDAEIRGYLLPRLKAGKRPTYAAMRADLGGGGFSRLVRIRNQVEAELSGERTEQQPVDVGIGAAELVAGLEALFERQWKALEEWERRSLARLEDVAPVLRQTLKATGVADTTSARADRLEAVERRLLAVIDKLQAFTKEPSGPYERMPHYSGDLSGVPPAWARQAAAAATSALEGRLQSIEETMRDAVAGGRAAFDLAAGIARELAADASLQLRVARSTLGDAIKVELAALSPPTGLDAIHQGLQKLHGQVGAGFSAAAAVADGRARAIRDVILAMVEIEAAQCEMLEAATEPTEVRGGKRKVRVPNRSRRRIRGRVG